MINLRRSKMISGCMYIVLMQCGCSSTRWRGINSISGCVAIARSGSSFLTSAVSDAHPSSNVIIICVCVLIVVCYLVFDIFVNEWLCGRSSGKKLIAKISEYDIVNRDKNLIRHFSRYKTCSCGDYFWLLILFPQHLVSLPGLLSIIEASFQPYPVHLFTS